MFAGAAFTDEADIEATEAVNMLTALGVITGYNDGSYQPDKVVTRAEMAKMIFVVRNNSIDDSAYANNSSKLTDISNHWAKGYIKFCESQGIIAGKGNNKFDPDASVTGVEAAKMLIGYSDIDSDGILNDVTNYGDIKAAKDASGSLNTSDVYRGSNEANVSNYIAVNDGKLNVTADTTVLLVNSDADNSSDIGLAYTYGDKLPKASKNGDDYLINAFWIMDEAGTDDVDVKVLVIDSTGAFKGFKVDDVNAAKATATAASANVKSVAYGTEATLKFDLALANYDKDSKVKFTATVTDKDGKAVTTGISGDLVTGVELTADADGVASADDKTVVFANSVAEGVYTVTVKAGDSTVATAKIEVVAATVASLDAVATDSVLTGGNVVATKSLADVKGAVTAATANVVANAPITVAVVGRDVAETYVPATGEKVTVSIKYTAAEHYQFTKDTTVADMAGAKGVLTVNADGTATVVYTFVVAAPAGN